MSEELKPCPFCGSKDVVLEALGLGLYVFCADCNSYGPNEDDSRCAKWNTRADPPAPTSDDVERAHAISVRINQIRDAYYQLRYSQTPVDIVEDHISALEAESKRLREALQMVRDTRNQQTDDHTIGVMRGIAKAALAKTDGKAGVS